MLIKSFPQRTFAALLKNRPIRLTAVFGFLFIIAALGSNAFAATLVVDDDSACAGASYTTIQAAVTAAAPSDTIQICPGTYPISSTINLNKAGLTLVGTGATRPVIQIPTSTGYGFSVNAASVTLDNLEIQKTDLGSVHNMIYVGANNFTAQNNLIYGPNPGSTWSANGLVSRAFEVTGSLSGLLLQNNTIHTLRQPAYINGGTPRTTGSILNNNVSGTRGWVIDGATINFMGNTFGPPANQGADIALLPSVNPADYPNLSQLSANNGNAFISGQFTGATSGSGTTYVNASAAPGGDGTAALPFQTIQQGVDGVLNGGTVNVAPGTYIEDVNVNKDSVILNGSGAANTTISGAKNGDSATIRVSANNAEIRGFTITRQGNNFTDWNDANGVLNSAGIAVQGTSISGMLVHDNTITGNRTGIDVNNSNGHTIRNNVIDFNRTGLLFRNQTNNLTVVENFITNNWTVGVLFLDASGGTNSPLQQALNSKFRNNNISGNWYGQVVDRQSGGSVPAPGTNLKDFKFNWWGTTNPSVTTANSTEPGYAAQIPMGYPGGTATAPGGQPDIAGSASANIIYTPVLQSGTDSNVETIAGRGTNGFQGAAISTIVKSSAMNGWLFYNDENDTIDNTLGSFVVGPGTPPAGVGSAQISATGTQRRNLATYQFGGTALADITTLKYSTYNPSAGNGGSADRSGYLHFNVDFNGSDTWQRRLVFLPSDNGTVTQNTWKEWDAVNGGNALWRYSGATWPAGVGGGGEPGTMTKTWSQILSQYPGVRMRVTDSFLGIRVGEPYPDGYTENIDLFKFASNSGSASFDFEPERPSVTINQASGQADPTSTSPINFTVTFSEPVNGFTSSDVTLGGTANPSAAVVTGGGAVYNVAVSGMTGSGTVTASIGDSAATAVSNNAPNTASTSSDNTVTYFTCNNVAVQSASNIPRNTQFTVPVTVDSTTGRGILSYQFSITYDPSVITPISVDKTGTLSQPASWTVTSNASAGTLTVNGFSTTPLTGSGTLLNLKFITTSGIGTTSNLNFASFQFNEGVPCVATTNGVVTVISGSIAGKVTYANAPTLTPVPNTTLTATGSTPTVSAVTNAGGSYTLNSFGAGAYTVTPSKSNQVNGISNQDASKVAQHVAGLVTLNATQMIAADVSGNGTVTAFDAALIAQFVAAIPNPGSTGTWRFTPINRSYTNVETNYTDQDYSAILMGEVTGTWDPNMATPNQDGENEAVIKKSETLTETPAQPEAVIAVSAPHPQIAAPNTDFAVPISTSSTTGQGITGYQFDLTYDKDVIMAKPNVCDVSGTVSQNLTAICNSATPGLVKVVVFGVNPTTGAGALIKLNFAAVGTLGEASPLTMKDFMFNEGTPQNAATNGQVLLTTTPTASSVNIGGRVTVNRLRGLANARVFLTDNNGETRSAMTNPFGYYQFSDVRVGGSYTVTILSKRYNFAPRVITVEDELTNLNFIAEP